VVEEVVVPMQSSVDPTLLLESDQSSKVVEADAIFGLIPLFFRGVMHLLTMSLAFPVQYLLNKGAFHSL
jgi:hypothetical protein